MARIKHRPSTPDSGFRPIQLSRAEITRMQQESNRIIENMERNRRSEIEQRQQILQTMKEDANYASQQEAKNFEIQQRNLQVEALQSQFDAKTQEQQANVNIKEAEAIFGGLAKFSQTAAVVGGAIIAEQKKKEYQKEFLDKIHNNSPESLAEYKNFSSAIPITAEIFGSQLKLEEAQGADQNPLSKTRLSSPALTHMSNKASVDYISSSQFPLILENALNDNTTTFEFRGKTYTPAQARANPELMAAFGRFIYVQTLKSKNLWGLEPYLMYDGAQKAIAHIDSLTKKASQLQTANNYSMLQEQGFSTATNGNLADLPKNLPTIFRRNWADNPSLGFEGALNNYEKLAYAKTADGSYIPMEILANADLKGNGKPFSQEFPRRYNKMLELRTEAEIKADKLALTIDSLAYNKDSARILQGLTDDPTQANANKAVEFFRDQYGKVPAEITKFQSSFTNEVIEKKEAADRYLAIPNGFLTREAVAAGGAVDAELGKELQRRYDAQEIRYNSGIYKETSEAFKTTANGITAYGTNKPNTAASVFLQTMMRAEYRKRVDQAVAGGADFNQAATTIGQELDKEVRAGASTPGNKWYRKPDGPGGQPTFPELNKGSLDAISAAEIRFQKLKDAVARPNGVQKTINEKDSIITASEAKEIVDAYGKPGFVVPQDVLAVSSLSNGLDPMVIINAQLAQHGIPPLQPPPSLSSVQQTVSPAFQKLLYKSPSINRSARSLGTSNMFNPAIIPNNLGAIIQSAGQRNGVNPSYIAALAEIESGFNPNISSYNGSSFGVMQINKAAHPEFFQMQNWRDPNVNIDYGAKYYGSLLQKYNDPVAAAMAYNAGPGNYDAYVRGELPDGAVKTEMIEHGKKFAKVMYKYGGSNISLSSPHLMRSGHNNMQLTASASSYAGMDTSDGPDKGRNACVWAVNKVMRAAGMNVPWGSSVYVPEVKRVLDRVGKRVAGPMPGAIAIMQDNHPTDPYPHMGIVGADGMIISNSTARSRFDWRGTPQEYEQKYGRPNLYYMLN